MIAAADPPRLAGEFTVLDPNAATIVAGPLDAFAWGTADG